MSSIMTLATTLKADAGQLKADLSLAAGPSLEEMERSAAKIQAHYRGKRDRAIVEVKRVRAEFIARSKAERDLMFAMKTQSTLANLTDVKAMTAAIRNATETRGWVIDPNHAEWTAYWDLMMMLLLTVVLFLMPYEVAFLVPSLDALFVINRLIDLIFTCDLVIQFFLAYQNGPDKGNTWVKSLPMIRKRYLKGWFTIDFISVLPFWIIEMMVDGQKDGAAGGDEAGGPESLLRVVRAVRLLRLTKLTKVLGMSRILKRYEAHMDVTYAVLSLLKMVFLIVAWSHLQACAWGMLPSLEGAGTETWLTDLAESEGKTLDELDPGLKYSAALYWSVMTLTSIGYGAMLPPQSNAIEMIVCVFLMVISSILWVYTMGQMCAIATSMDPDTANFHRIMDGLNMFMHERGIDKKLRVRLRIYFHNCRKMYRVSGDTEILERMSPMLRGVVALEAHRPWLQRVWYLDPQVQYRDSAIAGELKSEQEAFVAQLACALNHCSFVSEERIPVGSLYILRRGLCSRGWNFLGPGRVFGEDLILKYPQLIDATPTVALTYVEVLRLDRADMMAVASMHPVVEERIKRAALRIALARFLLKHLRKAKKSREARWKVKQMDLWKSRQVAQITTASTRSRGGGFNAEAMRSLVRDELRRGVDDALKRAMPGLAKMVVAEQRREAEKAPRRGRASSDSAFMMSRSGRSTSQSLLADLKGLWA